MRARTGVGQAPHPIPYPCPVLIVQAQNAEMAVAQPSRLVRRRSTRANRDKSLSSEPFGDEEREHQLMSGRSRHVTRARGLRALRDHLQRQLAGTTIEIDVAARMVPVFRRREWNDDGAPGDEVPPLS